MARCRRLLRCRDPTEQCLIPADDQHNPAASGINSNPVTARHRGLLQRNSHASSGLHAANCGLERKSWSRRRTPAMLVAKTGIGGTRVIPMQIGEQLPRIC
jgi:hypothetical protein